MSGDSGLAKQAITKHQQDPYGERRHSNGKNDVERLMTATGVESQIEERIRRYTQTGNTGHDDDDVHSAHGTLLMGANTSRRGRW